jgi:hypothetical protein
MDTTLYHGDRSDLHRRQVSHQRILRSRSGGDVAVPVVRPLASRNVVMPFESVVAVPVVRPDPSRNVLVPLLSVVTVPVVRPLASRNVVWFCADAAVIIASVSATMVIVFIAFIFLAAEVQRDRDSKEEIRRSRYSEAKTCRQLAGDQLRDLALLFAIHSAAPVSILEPPMNDSRPPQLIATT